MAIITPLKKIFNWQLANKPIGQRVYKMTPATDMYVRTIANTTIIDMGYVDSSVFTDIQFHLVNKGQQLIGDKLIIVSQPDTTSNNITYCFDDTDFYITQCGGPESPPCVAFTDGNPERDVTIFTFDGEKFCSTYDNC